MYRLLLSALQLAYIVCCLPTEQLAVYSQTQRHMLSAVHKGLNWIWLLGCQGIAVSAAGGRTLLLLASETLFEDMET